MPLPKLSVCLITYNQEQYIREALDGIVMQKCDFDIEVVASDDQSSDRTLDIIKEYADKYPYFNVLKGEKNVGMHRNWEKAIKACKGEYIALLEGDDLWNDERKLQKQIQILEQDKGIAISFTNAFIKNEVDATYHPDYVVMTGGYYTIKDLFEFNPAPTASVVFRNHLFENLPEAYFKSPYADWILHILNARKGYLHYLPEKTCTYRLNSGGVFGGSNERTRLERRVTTLNSICEILKGTEWYDLAKSKKKDARYVLKRFFLSKKDHLNYFKAYFA
jgi:glycosyltransferase involved in cell wall biosynthesis